MKALILEKDRENRKVQFLLHVPSSWLSQTSSLFQAFLVVFMQCLAWIFVTFIIFDLFLRCCEALSNLFSHFHEFNLAATILTHLKISKEHLCN